MPIWSLTLERLERLNKMIEKKKEEHDALLALSEKDLWVRDLDEFAAEWETQIALDSQIQKKIHRMGRRASKKIGAGTGGRRARAAADDDDYQPERKRAAPKAKPKPPEKTQKRFAEMFSAKPKAESPSADSAAFSDDDFAALSKKDSATAAKGKTTAEARASKKPEPQTVKSDDDFSDDDFAVLAKSTTSAKASVAASSSNAGRSRRAAAAKKPSYALDDSSEGEDDTLLGDVGDMVKGINGTRGSSNDTQSGTKLSLHAMNRPESSHAGERESTLPKLKKKASRTMFDDDDSVDDTNYEMLARSSPQKSQDRADDIDAFLSDDDDDDDVPYSKPARATAKPSSRETSGSGAAAVKKPRGRPAGSKNKPKDEPAAAAPKAKAAKPTSKPVVKKPLALSPAAKAYAAKKKASWKVFSDDDDDDDDLMNMDEPSSPPPRPAGRSRPGRAAAARAKPIYIDEDSSMAIDQHSDEFELSDD